jgi:hypothetical protein
MMSENETVGQEPTEEKKVDEVVEVVAEVDETAVTQSTEAPDEPDTESPSERPKHAVKRKKRSPSPAMQQTVAWFAACGRCSYFLTGYRLISDEDVLETAVANRGKKWLTVPWSHELAKLIDKTYGSRIDTSYYHIDGQCPECSRRFIYQQTAKENKPATFRIELKP